MIESYLVMSIFIVVLVLNEIDKRRSLKREDRLIALIKTMQNKVCSKDLGAYLQMEENDRPKGVQQVPQKEMSQEDLFDAMTYGRVNGEPG